MRYKLLSIDAIAYDDEWVWNNVAIIGVFELTYNIDREDFLLHCVDAEVRGEYIVAPYGEDCYELQHVMDNYRPTLALVPIE